jgi:hypothetical protein
MGIMISDFKNAFMMWLYKLNAFHLNSEYYYACSPSLLAWSQGNAKQLIIHNFICVFIM